MPPILPGISDDPDDSCPAIGRIWRAKLDPLAKGVTGGLFFSTDDCRATYEELRSRGVEFSEEPTERPYGIDAGFRDPSGNRFRLTQVAEEFASA